jgi:hypothetical protein
MTTHTQEVAARDEFRHSSRQDWDGHGRYQLIPFRAGNPKRTTSRVPGARSVCVTDPSKAVFLSYASQDAQSAQNLCTALRTAGIEVWFDQSELRGGDVWDGSIRRQIMSCALFIPLISHNTHDRDEGYFRLEWKLAVDRCHLMVADKAFLLPVVIDDTPNNDQRVPDRFREVQWTRLPGGDTSPAFVERVRRLLAAESIPVPMGSEPSRAGVPAATQAGTRMAGDGAAVARFRSRVSEDRCTPGPLAR